jgi:hypothetical protein
MLLGRPSFYLAPCEPSANHAAKTMSNPIPDFIAASGIVDVHEHHMPDILPSREVNLPQLFRQSFAGWTQARPYPLPSEKHDSDPMLCALAGERDVPVQMHRGPALIRGSHLLQAAGLIERHPRTRFFLMHLAYPWSRDLLGLAFVYRNIWLDLTWSLLLNPSYFKVALHEAIQVLPDESRLMIGGDNWHVAETYGTIRLARQLIGEVVEEQVKSGWFGWQAAQRLAVKILRENALRFFRFTPTSVA